MPNAAAIGLMHAVLQETRNVAPALGDCDDFNALLPYAVKDQVRAHGPEENRVRGNIVALMAYAGIVGQRFKGIKELCYPVVSGGDIIPGNVFPNMIEISGNIGAK